MGTQTQVSCQFCRNVFYLCLKHIKSWLVHHFGNIISDLPCAHTQLFILLLIWSCVHIIISLAIKSPRREEEGILSEISLSSILLSKWVYGTGDRGRDRDHKLTFPGPFPCNTHLPNHTFSVQTKSLPVLHLHPESLKALKKNITTPTGHCKIVTMNL